MRNYEIEFKKIGEIYSLNLLYPEKNLHSREVESDLRREVGEWKTKCATDILASPWFTPTGDDEDLLPLEDGSTHLIYVRSKDEILRWNDYIGSTRDSGETDDYLYVVESRRTAEGIKPEREWFTISVLFKHPVASREMYATLLAVGEEWTDPGLDLNIYAYYGDTRNRISWDQVRDTDRKFVFLNYLAEPKRFVRDGVVIKELE